MEYCESRQLLSESGLWYGRILKMIMCAVYIYDYLRR